ncbi:hypothetical protein JCM25156A_21410 [Komagataeibacter kakiaceti JCM 25156]
MDGRYRFFDFNAIGKRFPSRADSLIVDTYLSDSPSCSMRLFRIYHPLPRHFHRMCDEHLLLLSGRLNFLIEDDPARLLSPGEMVIFQRNIVHGVEPVGHEPVVFLATDTPRRAPDDVHFVDTDATRGLTFVTHLEDYG